jgi:hypothetical protein
MLWEIHDMRQIVLIFEEKQKSKLEIFLDTYCGEADGVLPTKQWIIFAYNKAKKDPKCLYINSWLDDHYCYDELYLDDLTSVELYSNLHQPLAWVVGISRIHDGTPELLDLIKAILSEIPAYVTDNFTDHLWTYEEIVSNTKVQGHSFFDYRGWSRDFRDISKRKAEGELGKLIDLIHRKILKNKTREQIIDELELNEAEIEILDKFEQYIYLLGRFCADAQNAAKIREALAAVRRPDNTA